MDLLPPGVSAAWADVRQFVAAVRFARPEWLWLGLAPFAIGLIAWWTARRAQVRATAIGRPAAVARLAAGPRPGGAFARFARGLAWVLLILGLAGLRWGRGGGAGPPGRGRPARRRAQTGRRLRPVRPRPRVDVAGARPGRPEVGAG